MSLIDKLGRRPLLGFGVAGIAVCMFVLAYGFHSADYTLSEKSISELSEKIDTQQLQAMQGVTYEDDLSFKQAITDNLGAEKALEFESDLIKAAANMNSTLILIAILGFVASFAVSIGPVMWVLFSELFPNHLRGLAISMDSFERVRNKTFASMIAQNSLTEMRLSGFPGIAQTKKEIEFADIFFRTSPKVLNFV